MCHDDDTHMQLLQKVCPLLPHFNAGVPNGMKKKVMEKANYTSNSLLPFAPKFEILSHKPHIPLQRDGPRKTLYSHNLSAI